MSDGDHIYTDCVCLQEINYTIRVVSRMRTAHQLASALRIVASASDQSLLELADQAALSLAALSKVRSASKTAVAISWRNEPMRPRKR